MEKISGPLHSKEAEAFFPSGCTFRFCSLKKGPIYAEFHTLFKRVQVYMNFLFSDLYDVDRFRKRGRRNGQWKNILRPYDGCQLSVICSYFWTRYHNHPQCHWGKYVLRTYISRKWDLGVRNPTSDFRAIIILFLLIATVQQLHKYYIWPHAFITTSFLFY